MIFLIISLFISCSTSELFEKYYKKAEKIVSGMTLEEKVGQMFFPRFNNDTKYEDITTKYPGGFVLFAYDFNENKDIIIKNIEYIQNISLKTSKLPLGLAVDEEGGTVNRISRYHRDEKFPSPHDIYTESGLDGILKIDKEKRDLLREFKMNVNLAPVADISDDPNDYIYPRTLGYSLEETVDYIKNDVKDYVEDNFTCCAKHFPGYGNNIDTHGDIAIDERDYDTFLNKDFKTFEAAIKENIPMILVSHNIVKCKDDKYPASISKAWHDILRNELKYSGLILTDDLSMEAIKKYTGNLSPSILAINAGNDILLTSDFYEHLEAAIEAVNNKTISIETINTACKRIIAWKLKYLLGDNGNDNDDDDYDEDKDDDDKDNLVLVICLSIVGIIVLGIIFYFLLKFCDFRKNKVNSEIISGGDSNLL